MLKTTALCLACLASLSFASVPAFANYSHCTEQPSMPECRSYNTPSKETLGVLHVKESAPYHAQNYQRSNEQGSAKRSEKAPQHARNHQGTSSHPSNKS
ncbi:MAG TPA: hypothetical protein VIG52_08585 [Methyloceanibacter sp.]|jgi:hypothetical protein